MWPHDFNFYFSDRMTLTFIFQIKVYSLQAMLNITTQDWIWYSHFYYFYSSIP